MMEKPEFIDPAAMIMDGWKALDVGSISTLAFMTGYLTGKAQRLQEYITHLEHECERLHVTKEEVANLLYDIRNEYDEGSTGREALDRFEAALATGW
jgi:hypothetical protein